MITPTEHSITHMYQILIDNLREYTHEYNAESENRLGFCINDDTLFICQVQLNGITKYKAAEITDDCIIRWYNAFVSEDKDILESFPDSMGNWEE